MKKITLLFIIAIIAIGTYSCKKDDGTKSSTIDSYVGIWNAKDTSFDDAAYTVFLGAEISSFSITKKDDTHINISNMLGIAGTTVWAVTTTALSYESGASGSNESFLSSFVGKKIDNKIYFTADDYVRGVIEKQ